MNWTAFLLLGFYLHVSANGNSQTITFTGDKVPLETVFRVIQKQTGFKVLWSEEMEKTATPITIVAKEMQLNIFLEKIFKDQSLTYKLQQSTIVIGKKEPAKNLANTTGPLRPEENIEAPFPESSISGTVKDPNGKPLQGVSVIIQKSERGTATDEHGNFSFKNLPPGFYTLELSLVSYSKLIQEVYLSNVPFQINLTCTFI